MCCELDLDFDIAILVQFLDLGKLAPRELASSFFYFGKLYLSRLNRGRDKRHGHICPGHGIPIVKPGQKALGNRD